MVVICAPATALRGTEQDRVATPFTCTVQAPHWAMPQPYLVPVMPSVSRSTQSKGVSGSTSTLWDWPLMMSTGIVLLPLCRPQNGRNGWRALGRTGGDGVTAVSARRATIACSYSNEHSECEGNST